MILQTAACFWRLSANHESSGLFLLLDEARTLSGKRIRVRDRHDSYANIDRSFLRQRLEGYGGLAILTTNLKRVLVRTFLRRPACGSGEGALN